MTTEEKVLKSFNTHTRLLAEAVTKKICDNFMDPGSIDLYRIVYDLKNSDSRFDYRKVEWNNWDEVICLIWKMVKPVVQRLN